MNSQHARHLDLNSLAEKFPQSIANAPPRFWRMWLMSGNNAWGQLSPKVVFLLSSDTLNEIAKMACAGHPLTEMRIEQMWAWLFGPGHDVRKLSAAAITQICQAIFLQDEPPVSPLMQQLQAYRYPPGHDFDPLNPAQPARMGRDLAMAIMDTHEHFARGSTAQAASLAPARFAA